MNLRTCTRRNALIAQFQDFANRSDDFPLNYGDLTELQMTELSSFAANLIDAAITTYIKEVCNELSSET